MADPRADDAAPAGDVRTGTRVLLASFVGLTLLAVLALLVFSGRTDEDFAWSIRAEITAAFLGAAFAAGCLLSLLSLRQRRWAVIRVPVGTVAVFTAIASTATIVHHHRLHLADGGPLARSAAWLWLVVYLVVPLACVLVISREETRHRPQPVRRPLPRWLRSSLAVQGIVLVTAGAVLFVGCLTVHHEATAVTHFWPWDLTPLSGEVIGAWLIAFGVAAGLAIRDGDLTRLVVPAVAYTVFGVLELLVLLRFRASVRVDDPWLWGYVALLLAAVGTGGYGWWAAGRRAAEGDDAMGPAPAVETALRFRG